MNNDNLFHTSINFINSIGIETVFCRLNSEDCFLPGIFISNGKILIDKEKLLHPGDIIHEAGHLAVIPSAERMNTSGPDIAKRKDAASEEMMAIAWSYAACKHLAVDPAFVFHEEGYKGGGKNIIEDFDAGRYFGVPVLQWLGMTVTKSGNTAEDYPAMHKWLRD
ncbi:hypothetical protein [Lacibacter luteus]|uniref:hypothetical protein n=1 Tax=Lacibacter luteus TaxID=2508719 RepID=UPI00197C900D|nr:hypothetical protein [Lacibacter luteus]